MELDADAREWTEGVQVVRIVVEQREVRLHRVVYVQCERVSVGGFDVLEGCFVKSVWMVVTSKLSSLDESDACRILAR